MAKKKKAPEAKAPLRGLQDTPTNTNSYIVHDPDHELAMLVTDGDVDKVLLDGVDISGGGGGIGTATLTVTVESGATAEAIFPYIDEGYVWAGENMNFIDEFSPYTYEVPVPSIIYFNSGTVGTTSGDITFDSENSVYNMTGNCTINIVNGGGD